MSLEDNINVMGIDSSNSNLDNVKLNGTSGDAFLKNGQLSKTDNLLVLLVQGLKSIDAKMLNVRTKKIFQKYNYF